jgi:recombination protein RecT
MAVQPQKTTQAVKETPKPTVPQVTVPQTTALTTTEAFKRDVEKMKGEFGVVLPSHIPPEKFIRALQTAAQMNPDLAKADRRLLFGELMKCAQDGLIPDGREAVVTVFASKDGSITPKYNPMVSGLCKRARNSGEISTIDAIEVHQNDTYEAWVDEKGQHFKHVRAHLNRGDVILTYAYAITKDGGFYFEEISEEQMKHIEEASRAKFGPWKGPFKGEMRRKSALRRLMKFRLPSSSDIDQLVDRDKDMFEDPAAEPTQPTTPATTSGRLSGIVEAQTVSTTTPPEQSTEPSVTPPPAMPVDAEVVEEELPI